MKELTEKINLHLILMCLVVVGASNITHGQENAKSLSDFKFTVVESSEEGVKLKCQKGCAWEILTFDAETAQAVNQYGMTSLNGEQPKKNSNLANFLFTIENTEEGVKLQGLEGTAWTHLTFGMKERQSQSVNEMGMTSSE